MVSENTDRIRSISYRIAYVELAKHIKG